MRKSFWFAGLTVCILQFILVPPQEIYASDYYKGKTLEMINFAEPGGGNDIAGRLIAIHLGKFIPGNPTILHKNMPGGGGTIAPNYVYNIAKRDGLTCLFGGGKTAAGSMIRVKGCRYDYSKMTPTLAIPFGAVAYTKLEVVKRPEDIINAKGLIYGADAPPSMTSTFMLLSYDVVHYKAEKNILAYRGTGDSRRAFLKGEINTMCETAAGYTKQIKPLVKKGEVMPLWGSGLLNEEGNVVREPAISDLYTIKELHQKIYGSDPSGLGWEAFKMMIGVVANMSKAILFPPETEKYAAIVADACARMAKDPAFQADVEKIAPGNPVYTGKQLKTLWKAGMQQTRPEVVDWFRTWLSTNYDVGLEP